MTAANRAKILTALKAMTRAGRQGQLHEVSKLRARLEMPKAAFDRAALELRDGGTIILHHTDFPGRLSVAEREELISDGRTLFVGVALDPEGADMRANGKKKDLEGLHGGRFDSYDPDDPQSSLDSRKDGRWFAPQYLHMGDYDDTGSVGASNVRVWEKDFKKGKGKWWHLRTEGYGGRVVMIDTTKNIPEEAVDTLAALEDYPLICEEDHSNLEEEWKQEAAASWAYEEFRGALIERFPDDEDKIQELSEDKLAKLFWKGAEDMEWAMESSSAYIDVKKVAKKIKPGDARDL